MDPSFYLLTWVSFAQFDYSFKVYIFYGNVIDGDIIITVAHSISLTSYFVLGLFVILFAQLIQHGVQFFNSSAQQGYIVCESKITEADAVDVLLSHSPILFFPFKILDDIL